MNCFRVPYIQCGLSMVLLSAILNCSINTIDKGFEPLQKITALTEIESFTEFFLEEVFCMKGVIADSDKNDQDHSSAGHQMVLYSHHAIAYSFSNLPLPQSPYSDNYKDSFNSLQKEIESPPPKSA